eukprot:364402-Chlamydomonas_euryale.AAC.5
MACLPACRPTCLPACPPTCLRAIILLFHPARLPAHVHIRPAAHAYACRTCLKAQAYARTRPLRSPHVPRATADNMANGSTSARGVVATSTGASASGGGAGDDRSGHLAAGVLASFSEPFPPSHLGANWKTKVSTRRCTLQDPSP